MTPVTVPITVQRWAPYLYAPFAIRGLDMAAATFAMHVRQYRDAAGSPLISLTGQAAGTEGVSCVYATENAYSTSLITIQINEATIEAVLPFPGSGVKAGASVELVYDLQITGGGLPKTRWFQGAFTIEPGATQ